MKGVAMGMDIISSSGVVVRVEEAVSAIFGRAKKADVAKAVEAVKARWSLAEKFAMGDVSDANSLVTWISETAAGLVDKEGGYIDSLALIDLFSVLCESLGVDLPSYEFDYWTHARISGWEVPIGTPCIVFLNDGLFETKMTKEGKRLAKMLGTKEIQPTTWTVMSV